jgi:hypothetical protein
MAFGAGKIPDTKLVAFGDVFKGGDDLDLENVEKQYRGLQGVK